VNEGRLAMVMIADSSGGAGSGDRAGNDDTSNDEIWPLMAKSISNLI
jgi:hypothetical protein